MRPFCTLASFAQYRHCERCFTSAAIHTTSPQRARMDCHAALAMTADLPTSTEPTATTNIFAQTHTTPTKPIKIPPVLGSRSQADDTMP